jgi:hypothetical protein
MAEMMFYAPIGIVIAVYIISCFIALYNYGVLLFGSKNTYYNKLTGRPIDNYDPVTKSVPAQPPSSTSVGKEAVVYPDGTVVGPDKAPYAYQAMNNSSSATIDYLIMVIAPAITAGLVYLYLENEKLEKQKQQDQPLQSR